MKKFLTAVAVASLISTPALADGYRERGERREHHHGGGKWVAPLIGGVILGAIIGSSNRDRDDNYDRPVYRERPVDDYYYERPYYRRTCWIEERVDYYGYVRQYRVCR